MPKAKTRSYRFLFAIAACLAVLGILAAAQGRKAGLWEVTTRMTWQQIPQSQGARIPSGPNSPFAGTPRTTEVCIPADQVDTGTMPKTMDHGCQVTNVVKKPNGTTADIVCSGATPGTGTLDTSWTDPTHVTSRIHFAGNIQEGSKSQKIEWTIESSSVYKGSECGDVKPLPPM